jgi:hypothetical protein
MANQQAKIDQNYQKTLLAKDALTGETRPVLVDNATGRILTASVVAPDSGSGITQINADASTSQTLATGTSGTDFNIATASGTHTFNIPTASATNRGLLSTTDWSDFNSKQDALTAGEGVDLTGGTLSIDYATFDESSIDASNITLSDLDFSTITASQLGNIDHDQLLNYDATEHFTQTDIVQVGTVTSGTWQAGAIQEEYGGTGQSTYTKGDILYSDASNSLAKLPIGTDGQQLRVTSTGGLEWFTSSTSSASTTTEGVVELATNAEAESKNDTTKAVTPSNLGAIFLDEDDMASDSATKLASQQSIKAYSDSAIQTLTNKTLTTPKIDTINEETTDNGVTIDQVNIKDGSTITAKSDQHLDLVAGTNKLVKTTVLRQDDTTDTYQGQQVTLVGWGYQQGDDTFQISESVSFGVTFSSVPWVQVSTVGTRAVADGAPSSLGDFDNTAAGVAVDAVSVSTTGFTASQGKDGGSAISTNFYHGYSWIAIGTI